MFPAKQIGLTTVVSIYFPEKRQSEEISSVFFSGKFPAKLHKIERGGGGGAEKQNKSASRVVHKVESRETSAI